MLELLGRLNRYHGTTVVMVLHDINMAARYSDWLVAMREGSVRAHGTPSQVVTEPVLREVFNLETRILTDPVNRSPVVVPLGRAEDPSTVADQVDLSRAAA